MGHRVPQYMTCVMYPSQNTHRAFVAVSCESRTTALVRAAVLPPWDLVLKNGSEVTLNELCARLGLPSLPYLEDMPPELEVDWDKKD